MFSVLHTRLVLVVLTCTPINFSTANDQRESASTPVAAGQFVVKLHRQRVPVKSDSEAMSYKSVYFGTIFLGSPRKQEFSVVFDTGSGHVVVPSEECRNSTCRIHRRYNRTASPRAVDVDYDGTRVVPGTPRDQITVAFGTGEVTGQFVTESLCLTEAPPDAAGSAETADHGVLHQLAGNDSEFAARGRDCTALRVVMATEMSEEPFHAFSFDGVLGLGLDGLALAPEFSFFGMMHAQGKVAQSVFGVFLADNDDDQSEICFGGYPKERVRSELAWSPVALPDLGYWQVAIKKVRVGNKSFDFCDDGQCRAVVDTGTSLLAVPEGFADDLQEELSSSLRDPASGKGKGVDCRHAEGALLHFDIDGLTITLTASDYARRAIMLESPEEELTKASIEALGKNESAETFCTPTLMPIDLPAPIGPKLFIWGEPVLRKYYTLYDLGQKRIGFGLAAQRTAEAEDEDEDEDGSSPAPLLRPLIL